MSVRVRDFRTGDLGRVLEIERRTFPVPWSALEFLHAYTSDRSSIVVAELDGKVVGYAVFELQRRRGKLVGHLTNLAVDEAYRRGGVGSSLLAECLRRMREAGCSTVRLEVREGNTVARAFYEKHGFREVGKVRLYYGDEDAVVMELEL